MLRLTLAVVFGGLVLAGCGDGSPSSGGPGTSTATPTPAQDYFRDPDSTALNDALTPLNAAYETATDVARIAGCNKLEKSGYRTCLHELLDPYAAGFTNYAATLERFASRGDLVPACTTTLSGLAEDTKKLAAAVEALLADFDSDARIDQAADDYPKVVDGSIEKLQEQVAVLTRGCYAPEVLASLDATPTPSAVP